MEDDARSRAYMKAFYKITNRKPKNPPVEEDKSDKEDDKSDKSRACMSIRQRGNAGSKSRSRSRSRRRSRKRKESE